MTGTDAAEEATYPSEQGRAAGLPKDNTHGLRFNPLLQWKALFFKLRILAATQTKKANNVL